MTTYRQVATRESKYGISPEKFNEMLVAQEGLCPVCKREIGEYPKITPHVDHDHETGEVRGLLCGRCNPMLGLSGDSVENLERAIEYLKSSRTGVFVPTGKTKRAITSEYKALYPKEYRCWNRMKFACRRKGRDVAEEFMTFAGFIDHIGCMPSHVIAVPRSGLELYPNKYGNFEPFNVRWSIPKERFKNSVACKNITYNGETHNIAEWSEITGIGRSTLQRRLSGPCGWSVEKSLTTPPYATMVRKITFNNETLTLTAWAKKLGLDRATLGRRLDVHGVEYAMTAEKGSRKAGYKKLVSIV